MDLTSRFFVAGDPQVHEVAGIRLRPEWWSRPYEYAWAAAFASPDDVALDAGCGISHPFKWHLGRVCHRVYAVDTDPRINFPDAIRAETLADLGPEAAAALDASPELWRKVALIRADITHHVLGPFPPPIDRVYCLSVLEHLTAAGQAATLGWFARVLRPDGLVALTCDWPTVSHERLLAIADGAGLAPAGEWYLGPPPPDAIHHEEWGLWCFRGVLRLRAA